jgi:glycosyltransferase involved in cell wall biosynthesis
MTGISAVIATYNRKEELKNLFDSLTHGDTSFVELIIVDQNEDGLIDDLVRQYSKALDIKHLKFKERQNSKARNFGAENARHSLICFPDDDCWFDRDSLGKVLAYFDRDPKTDLLIIRWNQNPAFQLNSLPLTYKVISSFKAPIGYAAITLFMKKRIFFDLGGFDITFGIGSYIGGGEDTELIFKIANAKKHVFYDHSIGGESFIHAIPQSVPGHNEVEAKGDRVDLLEIQTKSLCNYQGNVLPAIKNDNKF